MKGKPKKHADLESDLTAVLYYLCADWGYCDTGLAAKDFLGAPLSADDFAVQVLAAEGLNPESEIKQRRALRNFFRDRYGEFVSQESYAL